LNNANESGYGINASCWACHNSSGNVVPNNTHPDRRDTPYNCTSCHLSGGEKEGAYNATIIYNHYRNGTNVTALNNQTTDLASCIGCHENVPGMITSNNDTDYGLVASDGINLNGGNTSFYHYGKNRTNFGKSAGSYEYCIYCHRNTTGEFNITFQDTANYSILNHSSNYNSSNPSCSEPECHNSTGSNLHGIQLAKPVLSLPNSTYCLGCHGLNQSGTGTNYSGAVTGYREKHNNSVDCTQCHLNSSKSIHPVRYLGEDGLTWRTTNSSAVNCSNCHQGSGFGGAFSTAPIMPQVQHSNNASNGSVWNSTNPYWTNTSQQSMCDYCHGDSRHNATPLGRPSNWNGSNTINSSITSNSNWCAGCHYQGYSNSGKDYTNTTQTFETAGLTVPPEITNHTNYAPDEITGYYNHSLTPDYNDTTCEACHGANIQTGVKMYEFVHNVSTGTCKNCHFDYYYMKGRSAPEKYVNSTMFGASPHGTLECEDCHTKGHNNIGARKACEDCHAVQANPITDKDRHNITRDPRNYTVGVVSVVDIIDCTTCHDAVNFNKATSQYGYGKSNDCNYCHTYPDKTYS
ncbi:MAG: cytochrome c3 family protein, partial [Candidatus Methanoperedens sp.]